MYIIAMHTIAVYIIAMHTIAIALCRKCTYLIAVHIALRPTHQESSRLAPGQLKDRYVRQKLDQLKAQSSMVKDRYVRQKLYQLKVQRTRQPKFTWCSFGITKGN